jgi:hypothetical protein
MSYDALLSAYSPAGWWKLNDSPGSSVAADSGSLSHSLTESGTVTFGQPGPVTGDTAASFDGSASYLASTSNYATPPLGTSVTTGTLLGWFQTSSTAAGRHVALLVNDNNNYITIQTSTGGTIEGALTSGGSSYPVTSEASYSDGGWHMAVLSFTGGTATLYADGMSAGSASFTAPVFADGDAYVDVGNWSVAGGFWNGDLAQVALLTTALTGPEVSALYGSASGSGGAGGGTGGGMVAALIAAGIIR